MFRKLKGLENLHSLNIIHRDINPKKILISAEGCKKISEFANSINNIESKLYLIRWFGNFLILLQKLYYYKIIIVK